MSYDENSIPPVEALMPILQFDKQDLQANQQGQMGHRQKERLQLAQWRSLMIGAALFFALTLLATMLLFFGTTHESLVMQLAGIFTTLINAIVVGLFGRQWLRLRIDLRSNQVETLSGDLERIVRANGRINNFILRIDGEDIFVKKDLFNLVRQDVHYTLYRAAHSHLLLAAEPTPQN